MGKGVSAILNLGFEVDTWCMEVSAFVKPHALCLCLFSPQHHLGFLVCVQSLVPGVRHYVMVTISTNYELYYSKLAFL